MLVSIGKAAKFLDASLNTLRDWEEKGYIKPYRTPGNHRRYELAELMEFKKNMKREIERNR